MAFSHVCFLILNSMPCAQVVWQAGFQATSTEGTQQFVTLCGGSVIGNGQYVLTAGHCVKKIR